MQRNTCFVPIWTKPLSQSLHEERTKRQMAFPVPGAKSGCVSTSTTKFKGCVKEVSGKFQGCLKKVSRVFQVRLKGVLSSFKGVSSVFERSSKGV